MGTPSIPLGGKSASNEDLDDHVDEAARPVVRRASFDGPLETTGLVSSKAGP